jgi:hypothetical protein
VWVLSSRVLRFIFYPIDAELFSLALWCFFQESVSNFQLDLQVTLKLKEGLQLISFRKDKVLS